MTALDVWSPALAPSVAPLDDELPLCLSQRYTPEGGLFLGPLTCLLYAGHPEATSDARHCGGSAATPSYWTDEEAAASLAEYRASAVKTGPLCTDCESRPQSGRGRCRACLSELLAADNFETESEDAA